MPAAHFSPARIEELAAEGREILLREGANRPPPEVVNLDASRELGEPLTLPWDGETFDVRTISYRDGLALMRVQMWIDRRQKEPPATLEDLEDDEAELIQALALFHSLLDPTPEVNPFADATPAEVGALLGFFWASLTTQRGQRSRLTVRGRST